MWLWNVKYNFKISVGNWKICKSLIRQYMQRDTWVCGNMTFKDIILNVYYIISEYPIIFFKTHLKSDMMFKVYELDSNANACIESRKILTPFNGYLIPKEIEYYCQLLFSANIEELTNVFKLTLNFNTVTVVQSPFPL